MTMLEQKHCLPCEGLGSALDAQTVQKKLQQTPDWQIAKDHKILYKDFPFKNYYHVIAFVNALAWMAHHENHHPDLEVGYNHCLVRYTTHALGGLSENDFICAAKTDMIFQPYQKKQQNQEKQMEKKNERK